MKKRSFLSLAAFIVLVAMSLQNVSAQQTVNVGSGFDYWVTLTGTNTYNFEVLVSPAYLAAPGADYTLTNGANDARKHIVWNTANAGGQNYRIRITETSPAPANCPGTPVTYDVTVNATGSVQFASTGPGSTSCSVAGAQTINLTVSGTVVYPISLTVTTVIDGVTTTGVSLTGIAGPSINITDLGINTSTGNRNNSVVITAASAAGGGTLNIGTNDTYTVPVYGTPSTSTISHD